MLEADADNLTTRGIDTDLKTRDITTFTRSLLP